ncbi:hypothetical protein SO694_00008127 [Aureococcus anophagefferens]|uniref:PH domain-containing protein n=1 Tax=Aureococcus anophagefferens TaxID=44056 RepID=A0ABR1GE73_AURAN
MGRVRAPRRRRGGRSKSDRGGGAAAALAEPSAWVDAPASDSEDFEYANAFFRRAVSRAELGGDDGAAPRADHGRATRAGDLEVGGAAPARRSRRRRSTTTASTWARPCAASRATASCWRRRSSATTAPRRVATEFQVGHREVFGAASETDRDGWLDALAKCLAHHRALLAKLHRARATSAAVAARSGRAARGQRATIWTG